MWPSCVYERPSSWLKIRIRTVMGTLPAFTTNFSDSPTPLKWWPVCSSFARQVFQCVQSIEHSRTRKLHCFWANGSLSNLQSCPSWGPGSLFNIFGHMRHLEQLPEARGLCQVHPGCAMCSSLAVGNSRTTWVVILENAGFDRPSAKPAVF